MLKMLYRKPIKFPVSIAIFLWAIFVPLSGNTDEERPRVLAVTQPAEDFSGAETYELRPGGAATVFKMLNRDAFSHPSANMPFERQLDFRVGDGIFKKIWVSSPSSTRSSDGLGPLFNARSCQRCHLKDGRGRPPAEGEKAGLMLLKLSIPPQNETQRSALLQHRVSSIPEPTYGNQLQNFSVQGVRIEGEFTVQYKELPVRLADGEVVNLRAPTYQIVDLQYDALHPDSMASPRVAPPVIGMGLLEAIPEVDILRHVDPDDLDGDGVSGRARQVWSDEHQKVMLGRFGWKAGQPTLVQQSATAFRDDIGISTPLYPVPHGDCTAAQQSCMAAPHGDIPLGDGVEAVSTMFDMLMFYIRNLGVPARREVSDPQVLEGKRLFYEARCTVCHVPKFVTRRDSIGKEQSFQLIWPYTDLLLHDMGEGLADNRPEGNASGREWRTPPLWGIGLTETVSHHSTFLHDGRARSLLEAILWHGGEAEAAKQQVVRMTRGQRESLLAFLGSL
ncbi:MAG: c-type cytochrome [Proteobacteria bacterium]|nr:c-type cytochrome [Pseudomonadota bacterium]